MTLSNDTLAVKNFGPIYKARVELASINIFIGPSATGKSIMSKLCAALKDFEAISRISKFHQLKNHLGKYDIEDLLTNDTYLKYETRYITIIVQGGKLKRDRNVSDVVKSYLGLRQLANVDIEADENIYNPDYIRNLFRTLVSPFIPTINNLNNKSFNQLINVIRQANDLYNNLGGYYGNDELEDTEDFDCEDLSSGEFQYSKHNHLIEYALRFFESSHKELDIVQKPVYIPAERILYSFSSESSFSLNKTNVNIPKILTDFGSLIEVARKRVRELKIDFLKVNYSYKDKEETIVHNRKRIPLSRAASGIQTLIPLYLGMQYSLLTQSSSNTFFVIEEPELNLYPNHQKRLVEDIISHCFKNNNKLIFTTHSPYILSTINNLIQAKNAFRDSPEKKSFINEVVPSNIWLDFTDVKAYYFNNGEILPIMNSENMLIDANEIDTISEELGIEFSKLLDLQFDD